MSVSFPYPTARHDPCIACSTDAKPKLGWHKLTGFSGKGDFAVLALRPCLPKASPSFHLYPPSSRFPSFSAFFLHLLSRRAPSSPQPIASQLALEAKNFHRLPSWALVISDPATQAPHRSSSADETRPRVGRANRSESAAAAHSPAPHRTAVHNTRLSTRLRTSP